MEIVKEFNEQYNFWVVKCSKGHKITTWNEGDDILEYGSFTIAYCPKDADLDVYHTFTAEQDVEYTKQREEEEKRRQPEPEAKRK